jgi:hypothetical protein
MKKKKEKFALQEFIFTGFFYKKKNKNVGCHWCCVLVGGFKIMFIGLGTCLQQRNQNKQLKQGLLSLLT